MENTMKTKNNVRLLGGAVVLLVAGSKVVGVNAFIVTRTTSKSNKCSSCLFDSYVDQYEAWNGQRMAVENNGVGGMRGGGMPQPQQQMQQRDYEYGMMKQQGQPLSTGYGGISQQEQNLRASVSSSSPYSFEAMNGMVPSTPTTSSSMVPSTYNFPPSQQEQYRQSLPSYMRDTSSTDPSKSMMPYSPPIRNGSPGVADPARSMMPYSPPVVQNGVNINGGDLRHTFNRQNSNSALDVQGPNRYERYGAEGNRLIQGDSRQTFSTNPYWTGQSTKQEVVLTTAGGPLDAKVELWDGPNNTPTSLKVFSEDGQLRPFYATIETQNPWNPYHSPGTSTSIRNEGPMEFPLKANISPASQGAVMDRTPRGPISKPVTVDGGALKTWSFNHDVQAVHIKLTTDGLPLMALVELWGCGGHTKQIAEIYQDDGLRKPFYATIPTPGYGGDTIAIRNKGPLEYPITASVEPLY